MHTNDAIKLISHCKNFFPETFSLRAFRGETFRISIYASYVKDYDGKVEVMLYTERLCEDGVWKCFAKGTVHELSEQVVCGWKEREKFSKLRNDGTLNTEDY